MSPIGIRLCEVGGDRSEWNNFVSENDNASLFHSFDWIDLISSVYDVEPVPLGVFREDAIVGVYPTFIQKKYGFKFSMSPPWAATPYGGPLVDSSLIEEVVRSYIELMDKRGVGLFNIVLPPHVPGECLSRLGFDMKKSKTVLMDLRLGQDVLWKNMKQKCRSKIRKAQKRGVIIQEEKDESFIDEYYLMLEETFNRRGTKPSIPKKFYFGLFNQFSKKESIKFLTARVDGKMIAGGIFPQYNGIIYYLDGCSLPGYHNYSPNNLIQWELIKFACENGFQKYDMLGADIPGIAEFKQSFGGQTVQYDKGELYSSRLVKYLMVVYRYFRGIS